VLVDEINRATPKTQAALLEAMKERQVTVDGITHLLPRPFMVAATQNPIEYEGTFPLPETQLDRFLLRIRLGYPSQLDEINILEMQQIQHPYELIGQL
jgi:MoxR-like ATPase